MPYFGELEWAILSKTEVLENWGGPYYGTFEGVVLWGTGVGRNVGNCTGPYCGRLEWAVLEVQEWAILWKTKVGLIVEQ